MSRKGAGVTRKRDFVGTGREIGKKPRGQRFPVPPHPPYVPIFPKVKPTTESADGKGS